jgi:N-acetylglutamate kinase (EC 2.7.2.8)
MKITEMVLTGKIAPEIVSLFSNHDIKALGLSGKDGNIIKAKQKARSWD